MQYYDIFLKMKSELTHREGHSRKSLSGRTTASNFRGKLEREVGIFLQKREEHG